MDGLWWKNVLKWMMTGATPNSGNLHLGPQSWYLQFIAAHGLASRQRSRTSRMDVSSTTSLRNPPLLHAPLLCLVSHLGISLGLVFGVYPHPEQSITFTFEVSPGLLKVLFEPALFSHFKNNHPCWGCIKIWNPVPSNLIFTMLCHGLVVSCHVLRRIHQ